MARTVPFETLTGLRSEDKCECEAESIPVKFIDTLRTAIDEGLTANQVLAVVDLTIGTIDLLGSIDPEVLLHRCGRVAKVMEKNRAMAQKMNGK